MMVMTNVFYSYLDLVQQVRSDRLVAVLFT